MTTAITACDSSPCANSGNCTSMDRFNFTCQCVVGYSGPTCEVSIDVFVFEFELLAVNTVDDCDVDVTDPRLRPCEPILQVFCLREGRDTQSNNMGDCPLGRNDTVVIAYTPDDIRDDLNTRPGLPSGAVTRRIMSQRRWPVRHTLIFII